MTGGVEVACAEGRGARRRTRTPSAPTRSGVEAACPDRQRGTEPFAPAKPDARLIKARSSTSWFVADSSLEGDGFDLPYRGKV